MCKNELLIFNICLFLGIFICLHGEGLYGYAHKSNLVDTDLNAFIRPVNEELKVSITKVDAYNNEKRLSNVFKDIYDKYPHIYFFDSANISKIKPKDATGFCPQNLYYDKINKQYFITFSANKGKQKNYKQVILVLDGQFNEIRHKEYTELGHANDVLLINDKLLVLTQKKIFYWINPNTLEIIEEQSLPNNSIPILMTQDHDGNILFLTDKEYDKGTYNLYFCDEKTLAIKRTSVLQSEKRLQNYIQGIIYRQGSLFCLSDIVNKTSKYENHILYYFDLSIDDSQFIEVYNFNSNKVKFETEGLCEMTDDKYLYLTYTKDLINIWKIDFSSSRDDEY